MQLSNTYVVMNLLLSLILVQSGITPLMAAATKGHAETVQILLEAGANVHHQDQVNMG